MNDLTDKEVLALDTLCNAVADGTINEEQKAQLSHWLVTSNPARRYYIRAMGLSASLYSYASEMQAEAPDAVVPKYKIIYGVFRWAVPLAAAATIILVFWIAKLNEKTPESTLTVTNYTESVAQLTASKESQWSGTGSMPLGTRMYQGQPLELSHGFAEITFDSGAKVVLEGPASIKLNSAWGASLRNGTLKASVPHEAIGFNVSSPTVSVVDLGTEFAMITDKSGVTDLLVLKGAVEASPQNSIDQQTLLLKKDEARCFAPSGITDIQDSEQKFAHSTQSVSLDYFTPPTEYVHWSFEKAGSSENSAEGLEIPLTRFDTHVEAAPNETDPVSAQADGQAMVFDGRTFAKASFAGLSGNLPRTVAFWVNVPTDAQLSDAYAMVAWRAASQKLRSRPVHICWNRNPAEGTIGVLRTDYGGGFALGSTPLLDGRWHHIAVAFIPGENADAPVQVKQYVDGQLEGEGYPSLPGKNRGLNTTSMDESTVVDDTIWLGCRLGLGGPKKNRFRGELKELFIANRALEPSEIVQLMKESQPLVRPAQ